MLDEAVKRVREKEVPWNDIRNMAVLRRTQRVLAAPKARKKVWLYALVPVCSLALALVIVRVRSGRALAPSPTAPSGQDVAAGRELPEPHRGVETMLQLADGSTARGGSASSVHIETVHSDRAELVQTAGVVHYDVVHRPERLFVVRARDVTVSVLGTAFDIDVSPTSVSVRVERGSVVVVQQERHVLLEAGESLTLDAHEAEVASPVRPLPAPTEHVDVPVPPSPSAAVPPPAQLLERADRARSEGDLEGAANALRELLQRYPNDSRAALAEFMLGRVESGRGAHREAAQAFAACLARKPAGSLAEDALAELARAEARAGDRPDAVAAARRYLAAHPGGVHQRAMKQLVDGAN